MYSEKRKSICFVLILCCIMGLFCGLIFIPKIRGAIIEFAEMYIVHRPLTKEVWHQRFITIALDLLVMFVLFAGVFCGKLLLVIENIRQCAKKYPFVSYVLLFLPVLYGFAVVTIFGVNVIHGDEWNGIVRIFKNASENGNRITFSALFMPHFDHRMFFPRIIFYFVGLASQLNTKIYMYISLVFSNLSYLILLVYLKQVYKNRQEWLMNGVLLGFCVFCITQSENFLWGFQLAWFMIVSFAILSFFSFYIAYTTGKILYYIIMILSAIIASFSSLHGLLILPSILVVLLLLAFSNRKIKMNMFLIVSVSAIVTFFLYFGFQGSPVGGLSFDRRLINMFFYFLIAAGSSIALPWFDPVRVCFAAFLGLCLTLIELVFIIRLIKSNKIQDNILPLCLLVMGNAFCVTITLGRSGLGISQASAYRYTTISILIIIGLVLLATKEYNTKKGKINFWILAVISILVLTNNVDFNDAISRMNSRKENQKILADYNNNRWEVLSDFCQLEDIQFLERQGWSVFKKQRQ